MPSGDVMGLMAKAAKDYGGPSVQINYKPNEFIGTRDKNYVARVDSSGNEICDVKKCDALAINYSGRCPDHGGLYGPTAMSRMDRFRLGYIGVEQLDDEELTEGCTRTRGSKLGDKPQSRGAIMRQDQYRAMVQELYKRHDDRLRGMLDDAIDTMYLIMMSNQEDAADRIKAATWIFDRIRGKTPETLQVTIDPKPFEKVFEGIARLTRQDSERGIAAPVVDAEVVAVEDTPALPAPDTPTCPDVPEMPVDEAQKAADARKRAEKLAARKERIREAALRRMAAQKTLASD